MAFAYVLKRIGSILTGCALIIALVAAPAAFAQETFPARPVKIVVTFGPGGIADVVARHVAIPLGEALGQPVIVENRIGAGGSVGAQYVAGAPADGYTLLLGTLPTQIVNPLIYSRVGYNPAKDFVPISLVAGAPFILTMTTAVPGITDMQALIGYARAHPGKLNYGTAGAGGQAHLGMELFKQATGTDIVHVPYKSGAEAVTAAVGGQVDLVMDAMAVLEPFIKSQQLRALAITTETRNPGMPQLRTAVEQGIPSFKMKPAWFGISAPAATPPDRIEKLDAAIAKVVASPELAERFARLGLIALPPGRAAYTQMLQEEQEVWGKVIRTANIKLN